MDKLWAYNITLMGKPYHEIFEKFLFKKNDFIKNVTGAKRTDYLDQGDYFSNPR